MNKTHKALIKRFKITKNGKILRRATGQNHYRSKRTGEQRRNDRKWIPLAPNEAKKLKKYFK